MVHAIGLASTSPQIDLTSGCTPSGILNIAVLSTPSEAKLSLRPCWPMQLSSGWACGDRRRKVFDSVSRRRTAFHHVAGACSSPPTAHDAATQSYGDGFGTQLQALAKKFIHPLPYSDGQQHRSTTHEMTSECPAMASPSLTFRSHFLWLERPKRRIEGRVCERSFRML